MGDSAEIFTPFGHAPVPVEPDASIIESLERLLDSARKGELVSIAYATLEANGTVGTGWRGEKGSANAMLGAISGLQVRYTQSWLDSSSE